MENFKKDSIHTKKGREKRKNNNRRIDNAHKKQLSNDRFKPKPNVIYT